MRRGWKIVRAGRSQAVPGERWLDSSATLEVTPVAADQTIIASDAFYSDDQITTTTTTTAHTTSLRNTIFLQGGANQGPGATKRSPGGATRSPGLVNRIDLSGVKDIFSNDSQEACNSESGWLTVLRAGDAKKVKTVTEVVKSIDAAGKATIVVDQVYEHCTNYDSQLYACVPYHRAAMVWS